MRHFLSNIILAIVWVALSGDFSPSSFVFGFMVSYLILWLSDRKQVKSGYFYKGWKMFKLLTFFLYQMIKANIKVAWDITTPRHHMKPGILAVPLHSRTPLEITLLSIIVTLTPGTLAIDVASDKKAMFVHFMYIEDKEKAIHEIWEFEKRMLEVMR
jgi:multicomponent Na+:H+ antiporter subunit E